MSFVLLLVDMCPTFPGRNPANPSSMTHIAPPIGPPFFQKLRWCLCCLQWPLQSRTQNPACAYWNAILCKSPTLLHIIMWWNGSNIQWAAASPGCEFPNSILSWDDTKPNHTELSSKGPIFFLSPQCLCLETYQVERWHFKVSGIVLTLKFWEFLTSWTWSTINQAGWVLQWVDTNTLSGLRARNIWDVIILNCKLNSNINKHITYMCA